MKEHVIKLVSKDDLVVELDQYCKKNNIEAAFIATCVGSLSRVIFRKGTTRDVLTLDDHVEIVSCEGTLSKTGMHIHMSVSDSDFQVRGGHIRSGSIVAGTAEIVIIELENFQLSRSPSDLKNFKELKIVRINACDAL